MKNHDYDVWRMTIKYKRTEPDATIYQNHIINHCTWLKCIKLVWSASPIHPFAQSPLFLLQTNYYSVDEWNQIDGKIFSFTLASFFICLLIRWWSANLMRWKLLFYFLGDRQNNNTFFFRSLFFAFFLFYYAASSLYVS